ncbi:MAG: DUF3343 domain-containing protein [Candidatus Pelethousia sp.]|nr:DUF3343 domain-containing protein [Candidatus Pelethousia sp.]
MRADRYYILAFDSTHAAISAQRRLQGRVAASVMPTLRAIQAGCGISLRVEEADLDALKALLPELGQGGWRLYFAEGGGASTVTAVDLPDVGAL